MPEETAMSTGTLETFQMAARQTAVGIIITLLELFFFNKNRTLRAVDYELKKRYLYSNQFKVSRGEARNLVVSGRELTYGETPWLTIERICHILEITEDDIFYDLGCGTGKVAFYVNSTYDIETVGIDIIPTFIRNAKEIVTDLGIKKLSFVEANIFDVDWSKATIIYIAGTCFDDETIDRITRKLERVTTGTRIVTVSYPLRSPYLEPVSQQTLLYSWGPGTIYVHYKV